MTNRADTVLLGTTRKTINIKQDLAERHLKNACMEYYIEITGPSTYAINRYILPMYRKYNNTNADIMLVCERTNDQHQNLKWRIGILYIGGFDSWEYIPYDLEFHHGSYKLYTVVHYPKAEKAK